jgi:hypothetical protein
VLFHGFQASSREAIKPFAARQFSNANLERHVLAVSETVSATQHKNHRTLIVTSLLGRLM